MQSRLKSLLQYVIIILITSGLLWLSLRALNPAHGGNKGEFLLKAWNDSNKLFLGLVAVFTIISHLVRAERWRMLLVPTGNAVGFGHSFLSLMIGYLVNLAIPRGGEVSRCYNLYKLEKTPVEVSLGTVVAERAVDILCLLMLISISFFVEWDKLMQFIATLDFSSPKTAFTSPWLLVALLILLGMGYLAYRFQKSERFKKIFSGFKEGLLSVFQLKHKWLFILYSVVIWVFYFLMSYASMKAFSETSVLGVSAVLTLFALGSIAMAAPLPGGAGSYHTIIPLGLVMLYHLPKADAIAFVFIFHAWQTLILIVAGIVSLMVSYFIIRWRQRAAK